MKKEIYDIREMSDSKEIYGRRPNPFIPGFIYTLVGLLVIALIYSFIGKIEVVATANGIVRPNEDISTVAAEVGGRIKSVNISEGKMVEKGDILYSIDMSEGQTNLDELQKEVEKLNKEIEYRERFLKGIASGNNPFSSDIEGDEYSYYVRFDYYDLTKKDTQSRLRASDDGNNISAISLTEKIAGLESELKGLQAFKESIISGKNLLSDYPEYESQYLIYCAGIDSLYMDYQNSKDRAEADTTIQSNELYKSLYDTQIEGYKSILEAIKIIGTDGNVISEYNKKGKLKNKDLRKILNRECMKEGGVYKGLLDAYLIKLESLKNTYESTSAIIDNQRDSLITQYTQKKSEYENKLTELQLSSDNKSKEELLKELKNNYDNAINKLYYLAVVQAQDSIRKLESEIDTANTSLEMYKKIKEIQTGTDNSETTNITAERVKQTSAMTTSRTSVSGKIENEKKRLEMFAGQENQEETINSIKQSINAYERELELIDMYLDALETGDNPFSSDRNSDEYPYYVQFRYYELTIESLSDSKDYDLSEVNANIKNLTTTIANKSNNLAGTRAYLESIETGVNKVEAYPEFERQYKLYLIERKTLSDEYESNKEKIEKGNDEAGREFYNSFYSDHIKGCNWIIDKIKTYNINGENEKTDILQEEVEIPEVYLLSYVDYTNTVEENLRKEKAAYNTVEEFYNSNLNEYSQYIDDLERKKEELDIRISSQITPDETVAQLKDNYYNSKEQQYYQKLAQIENSIRMTEDEIQSAKTSLDSVELEQSVSEARKDDEGNDIKLSLLENEQQSAILNEIDSLQKQLDNVNVKIVQYENQISLGTVRAEKSGIVSMMTDLTEGDILTPGMPVATIIPKDESRFKVQIYVSNSDIGNIKVGDAVRYNIAAFPSSQYGVVNGVVTKVGSDVMLKDGQFSGFFLVEADIENGTLIDKDGNTGNISIGMQTEVKIVTQKKSIIRYLLEKLDLF